MPMPVSATSKATTFGAAASDRLSCVQPPAAAQTLRRTPPSSVNLKALESRFFRTCCRRFESVKMLRPELLVELKLEREIAALRLVPERTRYGLEQGGEGDFLDIHRDRAGLDLGQVENVADER